MSNLHGNGVGRMTIREIAAECGVSRGTVDRVINGRGKVHPETEMRVLRALQKAGYQKNIAGRALTVKKAAPVIAVLISSIGNPFFCDVIAGIRKAEAELSDYGVSILLLEMKGYNRDEQLKLIQSAESKMAVLVIQPIDDAQIIDKVAQLSDRGIRTVTINTDIEGSRRMCYVGSDYYSGGVTAAGVVRLVTGGRARLCIIAGVDKVLGHRQRLAGFMEHILKHCPDISIAAVRSGEDDISYAYQATKAALAEDTSIDTVMVMAAGLEGVCKAIKEKKTQKPISLFAFDNIPSTGPEMESGLVKAVICQAPFEQGYRAVRAAFDIILAGSVQNEKIIMENQIKIIENLS